MESGCETWFTWLKSSALYSAEHREGSLPASLLAKTANTKSQYFSGPLVCIHPQNYTSQIDTAISFIDLNCILFSFIFGFHFFLFISIKKFGHISEAGPLINLLV